MFSQNTFLTFCILSKILERQNAHSINSKILKKMEDTILPIMIELNSNINVLQRQIISIVFSGDERN